MVCFEKNYHNDPDDFEMEKSKYNVPYANFHSFLRIFHSSKNENVQQRTIALPGWLFEGQLQFHVRKEPQNVTEVVEVK